MHALKLYINQYQNDLSVIPLTDISVYDPEIPKQAPMLQVQTPNSDTFHGVPMIWTTFPFFKALNSVSLGLSTTIDELPDGIYRINFAMSPHAQINTDLVHYRVEKLRATALKKASELYLNGTEIDPFGNMKQGKASDILNTVMIGMRSVQQLCEIHGDYTEAANLYDRLNKLINTI